MMLATFTRPRAKTIRGHVPRPFLPAQQVEPLERRAAPSDSGSRPHDYAPKGDGLPDTASRGAHDEETTLVQYAPALSLLFPTRPTARTQCCRPK